MTTPGDPNAAAAAAASAAPDTSTDAGWDATAKTAMQGLESGGGVDRLTQLATGNTHLVTNPGLMNAVYSSNATPDQAGLINQFMAGLDAQKQVENAQATGSTTPITLSDYQLQALDEMGVNYQGVAQSQTQAITSYQNLLEQKGATLQRDASGNLVLDGNGQPIITAVQPVKQKKGFFSRVVGDTLGNLVKGWNVVDAEASPLLHNLESASPFKMGGQGGPTTNDTQAQQDAVERAQGYDPNSFVSTLAYQASGKSHIDIQKYATDWDQSQAQSTGITGQAALVMALKFSNDPAGFRQSIENDPTATPAQKAATLQTLFGKDGQTTPTPFASLVKEVGGSAATIGNVTARTLGLDPVKDGSTYSWVSGGSDFAASLALDPTLLLGKVNKADKLLQLGIRDSNGAVDYEKVNNFFRPMSAQDKLEFPRVAIGQSRWQDFIDQTQEMRRVSDLGSKATDADLASAAQAQRKILSAHPEKAGLVQDFTGAHQILGFDAEKYASAEIPGILTGVGKPITSLQEAGDYLSSKMAQNAFVTGKAALEGPFMPGATSMFGLKALKGGLAGLSSKTSVAINLRHLDQATSVLADAEHAVASDGTVVAAKDELDKAEMSFSSGRVLGRIGNTKVRSLGPASLLDGPKASERDLAEATYAHADPATRGPEPDWGSLFPEQAAASSAEGTLTDTARASGIAALQAAKAQLTGNTADIISRHIDDALTAIDMGKDPLKAIQLARTMAKSDFELKGVVQNNLLKTGSVTGERSRIGGALTRSNKLIARSGEIGRRMTRMLPRNSQITLGGADSAQKINQFMQLYSNVGDASLATALFNSGNEGTQRAIIAGIQLQAAHAAGWGSTVSGREGLKQLGSLFEHTTGDLDALKSTTQRYSPDGIGALDAIPDPQMGGRMTHYALFPNQVQTTWNLPSFTQLRQSAEKFGIYDRTFGRAFNSTIADTMMHGVKLAWLMRPATWTRNAIEGWLNAAMRGEAVAGWRSGVFARMTDRMTVDALRAQAKTEGWDRKLLAEKIDEATALPKRGIIAHAIRRNLLPHVIQGKWYNTVLGKMFDENDLYTKYMASFYNNPEQARAMMDGFGQQIMRADVDPTGAQARLANSEAGFASQELRYNTKSLTPMEVKGWEDLPTTGIVGATRWQNALGTRLEGFGDYGKELVKAAAPGASTDISALKQLVKDNPLLAKRFEQMRLAGVYHAGDGSVVEASSEAEKDLALTGILQKQIADVRYHLTGKDGLWSKPVADQFLKTGKVPDASWLSKNTDEISRPIATNAPVYVAKAVDRTPAGFVNQIYQAFDNGYKRMVEDPIQRTTTMPLYAHYYAQSRVEGASFEQRLVDEHGFTPEAADKIAHTQAMNKAWVKTEATVDDPGARTQLNIAGRNFLAFSRAAEAMIRRWGGLFVQDPTRIAKVALAAQAAEHSGIIYHDANGELNFSYPTFAPFINAFNDATKHVPFLGGWLQVPQVPDLHGKVLLAIPGVNQTLDGGIGALGGLTPLVNTPFRLIENFIGHHPGLDKSIDGNKLATLMSEFDSGVNGPIGAGEIGSQFEPALWRQWATTMAKSNDPNGMLASSTMGALTNYLAAHGENLAQYEQMTTDQQQQVIDHLQVGVRNNLRMRAALGMFMPAAPSSPNYQAGNPADFEFAISGTHGLNDEFKTMINDMGGDYSAALQLWTQLHPDKLVYAQPTTGSVANKAYLPATVSSLTWTENNVDFVNKYKHIAGYFLPETTGDFNSTAYQMQLSLGLRVKKTPQEFLTTALTNAAYPEYDAMTAQFDTAIAQAKAADDGSATQIENARAAWVKDYKNLHPTFAAALGAAQADKTNSAKDALADTENMLKAGDAPADVPTGALAQMVDLWNQYSQFKNSTGTTTQADRDMRTVAAAAFQAAMTPLVKNSPSLQDFYSGVFRQLDSKLIDLNNQN